MTLRLIHQAKTIGDAPFGHGQQVLAAFEKTRLQLSSMLGADGVHSLLTRALSRVQAEHPITTEFGIGRRLDAPLGDVERIIRRHGARGAAGIEATLQSMLELLGDLIGMDVVSRLVAAPLPAVKHEDEDPQ